MPLFSLVLHKVELNYFVSLNLYNQMQKEIFC